MNFKPDLPVPEFNNDEVSTIADEEKDVFESYYESTLIKEIRSLIIAFEVEENTHEKNYFQSKLKRIIDYYRKSSEHNNKMDNTLRDELYQNLVKEFGEVRAEKQINEFVFQFSDKNSTYKDYLVLLQSLLDEIKLHRELNIKPIIDSIINSNINSQEKGRQLLEIRSKFIENFSNYKVNERDDVLNYLYSKIYEFLVTQINSNDLSFYNHLTSEDKIHLKDHFIKELNKNKHGKDKTRFFLSKLASLNNNELDLNVLKEYLNTKVIEEDDDIYIPSTEERREEINDYLKEKAEKDRLRSLQESKPVEVETIHHRPDIYKTASERVREVEEYIKEKRRRDEERTGIKFDEREYSNPYVSKPYHEPARFSYLSRSDEERIRKQAELFLYIETKRRTAKSRGQKVELSDISVEIPDIFTEEEWNTLDEKEKIDKYMYEIIEKEGRRTSYR